MLINCVVYENGTKLADIPVDRINEYVALPNCFVWVALHDPTPEEMDGVQRAFDLHPLAVEDAQNGHQRPKVEEYGDSLFVVLHLLDGETAAPRASIPTVGELDVFVGRNYVVSVRNRSTHGFTEVRERCEREPELLKNGPGFVLYALMDAVVDRYFPAIDAFDVELEAIEERIFTQGGARENIQRLYSLKQRLTVLKHAVAPLQEGANKLHGGRVPQVCIGTQEYFRDVLDHLNRINGTIDAMRDTIGTAIQANLSMVTISDGEVTKRLAAWAAIFAVCTAFVGIWGMNFEHMPELKWRYGYAMALGLIVAVCGYLYYRFRKAGWV
ncbi:magnesium and cobalt transport protein CorA [Variovorax arabinosiphilus]|uniref:magnesium and cobalt transport protein CorA n=1 Tax=Variovorax arabinosiphilus TaxID=3053498 RepID=UPI002574E940|nr:MULTISPECIES: magnesium and cobalt transport protein CorA [unclassified Variovorax]MDM0122371.1 magnesium and cobalt transport protein CorA [Variovorax sp. J2L1-78]MDM0131100.1 magnesium and cobalt transport protein CorA [Variovorax sp. J2L1-63]MDM0235134.1 magnesium and cobalt transport protein CorA [Variovorax sp. J2R1-6]